MESISQSNWWSFLTVIPLVVATAGCHVPVVDRGRNIIDGIPQLGISDCCPPEEHPAAGCHLGNCDRRQYGPRPLSADPCCNKVTSWHEGADCDGRWTVLERIVGRRRVGHSLPFPTGANDGNGHALVKYTDPRTGLDDERVLQHAFLFFSVDKAANINGLRTRDEDILATNGREVVRCFDGSDVGMSDLKIDAIAFLSGSQILLSVSEAFTVDAEHALPGLSGEIDDSDVLLFEANRLGEVTRGSFSVFIDGSDVGLETDDEDIDALAYDADGLIISTVGDFETETASGKDEDLVRLDVTTLGDETTGTWSLFLDGSKAKMSSDSTEDIDGVAVFPGGRLFLSTRGAFDIGEIAGAGHDIFQIMHDDNGTDMGTAEIHLRGDSLLLKADSISGIELPVWRLPADLVRTQTRIR
jgi:hypothetical protein